MLDERQAVFEEVNVVAVNRSRATLTDAARLRQPIHRNPSSSRLRQPANLGRRRRLSSAKKSSPSEIQSFVVSRDAYPHRFAYVSANEASAMRFHGVGGPVGQRGRSVETERSGPRHAFAGESAHCDDEASREPAPRASAGIWREPLRRDMTKTAAEQYRLESRSVWEYAVPDCRRRIEQSMGVFR